MQKFIDSKYVKKMGEITYESYRQGWDERNGGNVSLRLIQDDLKGFADVSKVRETFPLGFDAKDLSGNYFLVTGTGRYFRNVRNQPNLDLGLVKISDDGKNGEIVWGFEDGGRPTSEFPAHLMSHHVRMTVNPKSRVVMHCHPTNLVAMTFTNDLDEKSITQILWKFQAESMVVFPEGIGVLPYMCGGTTKIGMATADKMNHFRAVVWPYHGLFATGEDLDEAFGLIETVEKSAMIYTAACIQSIYTGGIKRKLTDDELHELARNYDRQENMDMFD